MPETIDQIMARLPAAFDPTRANGVDARVQFDFTADGGRKYVVTIANGKCDSREGAIDQPDATLISSQATYEAIAEGRLNAATAFMTGKLKVKGNIQLLMRFQQMFHKL
jgi:putative sterol carrier protein